MIKLAGLPFALIVLLTGLVQAQENGFLQSLPIKCPSVNVPDVLPFEPGQASALLEAETGCEFSQQSQDITVNAGPGTSIKFDKYQQFLVPSAGSGVELQGFFVTTVHEGQGSLAENLALVDKTFGLRTDVFASSTAVNGYSQDFNWRDPFLIEGMHQSHRDYSNARNVGNLIPTTSTPADVLAFQYISGFGTDLAAVTFVTSPAGAEVWIRSTNYGTTISTIGVTNAALETVVFRMVGYQDCRPTAENTFLERGSAVVTCELQKDDAAPKTDD